MPREGSGRIARALFRDASVDAWELVRESDLNTLHATLCRLLLLRFCAVCLLSDAPGSSIEVPLVPVDVPLAPESIEPVPDPTDLEGLGVGFELDAGFPPWGAVSAAKAGAAANSAATAAATKVGFIGERFLPFFIR
jgi:hypothetical protein